MAGTTLGFLKFVLGFDSISFAKGATEAEARLAKMQKQFERNGKAMQKLGQSLSVGITLPMVAFGTAAAKTASDAAELQSAFDQTFGSMAKGMTAWAEATGNAMGRSTREIMDAANTFGIFFNTALPQGKAAEMSKTFAKLAQDLSSFYNLDPGTAMEKLRAGLSGEAEPLRAFGVFLTEAAVKAEAMKMGLIGANGQLSEQAKIAARASLILQQTTKAQGDVARTQDSTANQVRRAQAAWEELQIVVGTKLLPVLTPLIDKIASAVDWFTRLPAPVQNTALAVAAIGTAFGPLLTGIGALLPLVTKLGPLFTALSTAFTVARVAAVALLPALAPFAAPLLAIGAAVGAAYLAWKNWDRIAPIVQRMVAGVRGFLQQLLAPLKWVIDKVGQVNRAFYKLMDDVVGHSYIPDMVDGIGSHVARLDGNMVKPIVAATAKSGTAFADLRDKVQAIFDKLFPQAAAERSLASEIDTLRLAMEKGIITAQKYDEAVFRLQQQFEETQGAANDNSMFGDGNPLPSMDLPDGWGDRTAPILFPTEEMTKQAEEARTRVIETMGQMASGVLESIGRIREGLKSKDWLSAVQAFLDGVTQVLKSIQQIRGAQSGGVPGGGMSFDFAGARARGGPMVPGKSYLVGENGPELVTPRRAGFVHPNGTGFGERVAITVTPSPYFDVHVDGRAAKVAAPMARQAAAAGAAGGYGVTARRAARALA